MKEIINEIMCRKVDGICFNPTNDEGDVAFSGFTYDKKSKYEVGNLGHRYHILLYKLCDEGFVIKLDLFEATLTDPSIYISNLIKCGFYGVVLKKTKRSVKIAKDLYNQYAKLQNDEIEKLS
jgi:hypothetical protein